MVRIVTAVIISASIIITSSVSAAPERYPTNSEIKTLRQLFRQQIAKLKYDKAGVGYIKDRRSSIERQARNLFVKSWSKVDPSIAPFLGSWGGDYNYHIYPSNKRQRVCIIWTDEGHGGFIDGTISNGTILIGNGKVLFREGSYLGKGSIRDKKPQLNTNVPYGSPTLPKSVVEITNSLLPGEEAEKNSVRQGFKENGCTSSTPN